MTAGITAAEAYSTIAVNSLEVPTDWVPVTAGGTNRASAKGFYRALRANTAGTITVTMPGSTTARVLNFLAGETRYGMFTDVSAATATGVEGGI